MMDSPDLPKILLCDDEQLECDALQRIFSQSPTPVEIVGVVQNGLDAIQQTQDKRPDIVLMDISMPGLSGLEATRHILMHLPETQVIILSAYGDFAYAQEALRLGVTDYVLKPAEPKALYAVLEKALERRAEQRSIKEKQARLVQKLAEILPEMPDAPADPISRAVQYIRTHYRDDISLTQVAAEFSLSPAYFSRLFLKHTGSSFRHYLIWVRIEAAKFLLRESDLPVGHIAEAVGYQDSNHFSVRFKRSTGVSPNQYRRRPIEKRD